MPTVDITGSGLDAIPFNISFLNEFVNKIGTQIDMFTVLGVLASLAGVTIGIVFMWWGVRKVVGAIMSAFRSGKFSI